MRTHGGRCGGAQLAYGRGQSLRRGRGLLPPYADRSEQHPIPASRRQEEALPEIEQIDFSQDWRRFVKEKFYLERQWTDYPGFLAFRSRLLAYVAYYSPAASLLHKILYLFRQPFYNYKSPDTTLDPTDRSLSQPGKVRCVTVRD